MKSALDIDQIFDAISYLKGSSVIRMLSSHLTNEVFLKGVSDYLKKHAYGNAKTDDLWASLSAASGQDVKAFMDPWIRKIGFPVVTIAEEPGQITLQQSRFLSSGDVRATEDETTWWVPVGLKSGDGQVTHSALQVKKDTIRNVDDKFYKINSDQVGFYRTNYPPQRLSRLASQQSMLSVEDKIGLIGDAAALAISGDATTPALLAFMEGFQQEGSYQVWAQISASLGKVRQVFSSNREIKEALRNYAEKLVSPAVEKVGWDYPTGEDYLQVQLRKLLISMAAHAGHQSTIKTGQDKFQAYITGNHGAVHPNLTSTVFYIAVAHGGRAEYDAVKWHFAESNAADFKELCLAAMGGIKDKAIAREFLEYVTSDAVAPQDCHGGPMSVSSNSEAREVVWEFTKSEWDGRMMKLRKAATVILDRWMKCGLQRYSDTAMADDIAAFFKDKDKQGFDRSLAQIDDSIRASAAYKARDEKILLEWLKANGYA